MELRAYLDILRRRGWIILATAALAALLAFGLSQVQTKTYRATVRISAVPARPDWGLGNSAKDLLRNFVNNIKTHDVANLVIDRAQLDMNSYELLSKLTVSAEPENFLIRIDAKDQDPEVAKRIALTTANEFVDERVAYYQTQDKRDRIEVKLVDSVVDAPLYRPKPLTNALAGLVLGALIGAMIALLLEWMSSDVLASAESVERALHLPVLGVIPAAATAGQEAVRQAVSDARAAAPLVAPKAASKEGGPTAR
jgi:capsular polysaccharide biosynthesis protein